MLDVSERIRNSIDTGFIDKAVNSLQDYQPHLLINNSKNSQKVLTSIVDELRKCKEFIFCVAFITNGGVASLINILEDLEKRGIRGRIVASQYQNFTEPIALKRITAFKNIQLRVATESNLHSKGYIFKRDEEYTLIIGSSNLTQDALSKNYEWNLKISSTNNGSLIQNTLDEFDRIFNISDVVDDTWIDQYTKIYAESKRLNRPWSSADVEKDELSEEKFQTVISQIGVISPNTMQKEALEAIENLRNFGKNKALLISATGTGKTYLSAFDAKKINPNKLLFVIHRENIARAAMKSYKTIFGHSKKMGVLSGTSKITDEDFIFSTIQTMSKDDVLYSFPKDYFDYIIIDEVHRSGAKTYQKLIEHFNPQFLLGMTATPERTDGFDIYKAFDHNIAYEIRLQRALEEDMLCPFHYYGVTDVYIDEENIDEKGAFLRLTSDERVRQILSKSEFYGCDDGNTRGLVFCNRNEVCKELASKFISLGYRALSLSGENSEEERENAIKRLESDDSNEKLDYIFTVDIFNEGVDIPRVNQIIMLRPTQSAIIFVQQLGRGLRKRVDKDYLTVIDFIGNYQNNYLVPIALYGDSSYNKDHIRKLMTGGSRYIPGASTVDFDEVSRQQIYESINNSNLSLRKDLTNDYRLLKYKLGRIPMMMDFIIYGSRDPWLYVDYSKSYFNFIEKYDNQYAGMLNNIEKKALEVISSDIANGKRIEEIIVLRKLTEVGSLSYEDIRTILNEQYGIVLNKSLYKSIIINLNFLFTTEKENKKLISVGEKHGIQICTEDASRLTITTQFTSYIENKVFHEFLLDALNYAEYIYNRDFTREKFFGGFILYKKYSRKDAFRILNWEQNPVAQNVGGYIISKDKSNCPIFVNYDKEENISATTMYEDRFLSKQVFQWMSKSKRNLHSPDIETIKNYKSGLRLPLFIKKHNDEGPEFYYMGDTEPMVNNFEQMTISAGDDRKASIVRMELMMKTPVDNDIYEYLVSKA
ncbi:MAG: DUF3427 domain-containing protein [Saccharofermentanales bacterium]